MQEMSFYALLNLSNFILCATLLLMILIRNQKDPRILSFSAFLFFICVWSLNLFLWQYVPNDNSKIHFFKIGMAAAILIVTALIHFVHIIIKIEQSNKYKLLFIHAINIFLCILEFTSFYSSFEERFSYGLWPNVTPIFSIFLCWWIGQVIYTLYLVYHKGIKKTTGQTRNTNKQLFLALCIGFSGGCTNWLIFYNVPFPPYLVIGVSIFAIWIGYIVFRHKLFDIEIIIKRTAIFGGLFIFAASLIFASSHFLSPLLQYLGIPVFWEKIIQFTFFIILFRPIEFYLESITNKWLYQQRVNYESLLNSLSDSLKRINDLDSLCSTIQNMVSDILQLSMVSIYLFNKEEENFHLYSQNNKFNLPQMIQHDDNLIQYITENDDVLIYEDLTDLYLQKKLNLLTTRILIPLKSSHHLLGFIIIGDKLSDKPFNPSDIRIFKTIQTSLIYAIENAMTLEKLKQSQIDLAQKEKLATIGVLSAGIKHEINNPLFVILGRSEMIIRNTNLKEWDTEKIYEYVQRQISSIKYNADRIKDIVERLSDFAKPINNAELRKINLSKALDDSIKLLGYDEEDLSHINFINKIPHNFSVLGDSRMLVQVFFNLINNAVHAMNFIGDIQFESEQNGEAINIRIIDNGDGIDSKIIPRIFDPFFTTKDTTHGDDKTIKGTGLGLHLVYNYIKKMNGSIHVESVLGSGTTFIISLKGQLESALEDEANDNELTA